MLLVMTVRSSHRESQKKQKENKRAVERGKPTPNLKSSRGVLSEYHSQQQITNYERLQGDSCDTPPENPKTHPHQTPKPARA